MRTTLKRLLVIAGTTAAAFACAAAVGTTAQAATTCHVHGAQYQDLITVTLSDDMCSDNVNNSTGAWSAAPPVVTETSFYNGDGSVIKPVSVTKGTFFDPKRFGPPGSETAWANVVYEAYYPDGQPMGSFTIYMRLWLTPLGHFHYWAGR